MTKANKFLLIAVAVSLVGLIGFWAYNRTPKHELLFETLFPATPMPQTLQPIACGIQKGLTGNGECVLIFRISQNDLRSLADTHGFAAELSSDTDHWPVDICNDAIALVARSGVKITPSFACYRTESRNRRLRIFYDAKQELAVIIGRGYFGRPRGQPNHSAAAIPAIHLVLVSGQQRRGVAERNRSA